MLGGLLVVVLILLLVGVFPSWNHSRRWGYYPTGGLGALLIVVLALLTMGLI